MKKLFFKIRGNKFIENSTWMMGEKIFQMAISLVVGMLTARYLGPSNFGVINYIAAFISFATPICNLGFDEILVKKFIEQPERKMEVLGTSIVFQFVSAVICSCVIIAIVSISSAGDSIKIAVAFLESVRLMFKASESIEFWYLSVLQVKKTSVIKMIGYLAMSSYRVFLLVTGKSVVWFAFATSLDMIVIAALYFCLLINDTRKESIKQKLVVNLQTGFDLLKDSYHFILSGLMVVIYSQMDKVMIQAMLGDVQVGYYSASYTVCNLWFFVPTALIASAKPIIMRLKVNNENEYLRRLKELYGCIFWLGVLVGIVVTDLSRYIIYFLYGTEYMAAAESLVIGIWYGIFAQLGSARSIWILCEKKNRFTKIYLFWGMIVNLFLNYLWIPMWGINGAALATLVTQIVTSMIAPLFYKETRAHTRLIIDGIFLKWRKREQ